MAIAIMAFGFLLARLDLYLQIAMVTLGPNPPHYPANGFGREAALALLLIGVAMRAIAALRFLKTRKAIDNPELHSVTGLRLDVARAALLVLLGLSLVI